jgi:hypothetical protein
MDLSKLKAMTDEKRLILETFSTLQVAEVIGSSVETLERMVAAGLADPIKNPNEPTPRRALRWREEDVLAVVKPLRMIHVGIPREIIRGLLDDPDTALVIRNKWCVGVIAYKPKQSALIFVDDDLATMTEGLEPAGALKNLLTFPCVVLILTETDSERVSPHYRPISPNGIYTAGDNDEEREAAGRRKYKPRKINKATRRSDGTLHGIVAMNAQARAQNINAMNTKRAAAYLDVNDEQMILWRKHGGGPKFHVVGAGYIYLLEELKTWSAENPDFHKYIAKRRHEGGAA